MLSKVSLTIFTTDHKLSETFDISYSFEAMVKILWNAIGRNINLKYIGTGFYYKFDDEPDSAFRGYAEEINPDEISQLTEQKVVKYYF